MHTHQLCKKFTLSNMGSSTWQPSEDQGRHIKKTPIYKTTCIYIYIPEEGPEAITTPLDVVR